MRVIAGLYDGTIHGWSGELEIDEPHSDSEENVNLESKKDILAGPGVDASAIELEFAYQAHMACVKALSIVETKQGFIMASGGSDDLVRVYNISKKREVGELTFHDNTVNCLAFAGTTHLLSGGEDGRICVWRAKDWACIHELKGHKEGPVTSIAVRYCSTIALSTSRDNSLRMWDLTTGKPASRNKLEDFKEIGQCCWSPDGSDFACVGDDRTLCLFSVQSASGEPEAKVKHPSRINSVMFLDESMIVTGSDDGKLRVFGIDGSEIRTIDCSTLGEQQNDKGRHVQVRVRSLSRVQGSKLEGGVQLGGDVQIPFVVTGLSTGQVAIWDITRNSEKPLCVLRARSSAHLTCVVGDFVDKDDEAQEVEEVKEEATASASNPPKSKSKSQKRKASKRNSDEDIKSQDEPKKSKKRKQESSKKKKKSRQ